MLPKRHRLQRSKLLNTCFLKGQRAYRCPLFDFIRLPAITEDSRPQFCVVVSKKVSNKANKRNLIRRRIKSIIQEAGLRESYDLLVPYSAIIIIAKPEALAADYQSLKDAFIRSIVKPTAC